MTNNTKTRKNRARINVSLPASDLEEFDRIADERRLSRSALIRECMLIYLKSRSKEAAQ